MYLKMKVEDKALASAYAAQSVVHRGDSGLDLYCPIDITIKAGETVCIDLQVSCEAKTWWGAPTSFCLHPRSSMSKTPLRLANSTGIIDAGYRGTIRMVLDNIKEYDYTIRRMDRLVQLCCPKMEPIKAKVVDSLSDTTRGCNGFGSTGR